MEFSQEATLAVNDYLDRVRLALPLSPSARIAAVDRLYQDILNGCAVKAAAAGQSSIEASVVQEYLATLGPPDTCARNLATGFSSSRWQWPGDAFAQGFRERRLHHKVDTFTKFAAERGEKVARISIDAAANALDIAAQKLREAAEKMKK
jgi:hypothetical protein